jgi:RNA polymerase sigma factor (sigma-70 family)
MQWRDPDRSLAGMARDGDRASLMELYERHKSRLLGFLVKMCGNRQQAEDTFQEVWVKVMRSVDTYDPERSSFRSWLYRIARNAAIDLHRREVTRRGVELDAPVGEDGATVIDFVPSAAPGPDRETDQVRVLDAVQSALGRLSERRRTAVLLRHQQGLSYPEIASVLGVPEGTAKTLTYRGILALRQELTEWFDA